MVYANPDSTRYLSDSPCMRISSAGESGPAPIPENLTTWLVSAFLAASMTVWHHTTCRGATGVRRKTFSTPRTAASMDGPPPSFPLPPPTPRTPPSPLPGPDTTPPHYLPQP